MLVWVIEYTVLGLSIDWESLFIDMYSPALQYIPAKMIARQNDRFENDRPKMIEWKWLVENDRLKLRKNCPTKMID